MVENYDMKRAKAWREPITSAIQNCERTKNQRELNEEDIKNVR